MNIYFIEVEKDVTVNPSTELGRPGFSPEDNEVSHTSFFLLFFSVRPLCKLQGFNKQEIGRLDQTFVDAIFFWLICNYQAS